MTSLKKLLAAVLSFLLLFNTSSVLASPVVPHDGPTNSENRGKQAEPWRFAQKPKLKPRMPAPATAPSPSPAKSGLQPPPEPIPPDPIPPDQLPGMNSDSNSSGGGDRDPDPLQDASARSYKLKEYKLDQVPGGLTSEYILGPGDVIQITDFSAGELNEPYVSSPMPILPDGTLSVHNVGTVRCAGLTINELNSFILQSARKYVIDPDIEVSLVGPRPTNVYILGEVVKPGLYTSEIQTTQSDNSRPSVSARSNLTVTGALQMAGGIKASADVRRIAVTRLNRKKPIIVNLWKLLIDGDARQDIAIQPGDVIYAPRGGTDFNPDSFGLVANTTRRVRVWGYVMNPGLFDLKPEDDVLSMIARAGGFKGTAKTRWVTLSRLKRDGTITTQKIPINNKEGLSDPDAVARTHVQPGDLIVVHPSLIKLAAGMTYNIGLFTIGGMILVLFGAAMNRAFAKDSGSSGTGTSVPVIFP